MKQIFYGLGSILIIFFTATSCSEQMMDEVSLASDKTKTSNSNGKDKVSIYHYSKGNDTWKIISISVNAVDAHLKHGDFLSEDDCLLKFHQGFESDVSGWFASDDDWLYGGITRVASGTKGITSSAGSNHAIVEGTGGSGPITRFDGYHDMWEDTWKAEIDVFLDPAWTTSRGFDYSVASNGSDGNHQRDFIFHVNKDASTGKLLVAASNNTNFAPREDLENINHYEVSTAGWYTMQHVFYNEGGVLAVDLNLVDMDGNILFTETRTDASDIIPDEVGGNRYGWFTFINVAGGIAVDESKRFTCPE